MKNYILTLPNFGLSSKNIEPNFCWLIIRKLIAINKPKLT